MSDKKQKLRLVDDPTAAERYANKVVGASFDGAACTITLGVTRLVPERVDEELREGQAPKVYITNRLALSPAAAVELINQLNQLLTVLSQAQQAQKDAAHSTSH